MEPKILEEDRDEWIYSSMKKYSNLYMFELEFPADTFEVIDETSICLSGCQPYSKKTEILQLALPPKLFPKDIEEGLCKDRDFQIVSGGYASSHILQIKPIKTSSRSEHFVACTQAGERSVTLYQLGDENCAVIKESCKLPLDPSSPTLDHKQSPGILDSKGTSLFLGTPSTIFEWDLNVGASSLKQHTLQPSTPLGDRVTKVKLCNNTSSLYLLGDNGILHLYDLRSSSAPSISFKSSKSTLSLSSDAEVLFSFDTIANTVGILDSYGGYERFDLRKPDQQLGDRVGLSVFQGESCNSDLGIGGRSGVLRDSFNIQFSPIEQGTSSPAAADEIFLVSGLDSSSVHILQETIIKKEEGVEPEKKEVVESIFIHDGHTKRVTAAVFHPTVERLVFSASVDSMLHAWQYIQ